jgi:hypothetical protein
MNAHDFRPLRHLLSALGGPTGIRTHGRRIEGPVSCPLDDGAFLVERPGFAPGIRPCGGRVMLFHYRPTTSWLRREDSNLQCLLNRQARYPFATPHQGASSSGHVGTRDGTAADRDLGMDAHR